MKKIYKRKSHFTIVELLVAMGVFSILMLALMQFFTGAQQIWQKLSARSEVFENARVALDLMATDLQCAYYELNHSTKRIFFAVDDSNSNYKKFSFATVRSSVGPDADSKICQVQYIHDVANDCLKVNEVWDNDTSKWTVLKDQGDVIAGIFDFSKTAFNNTAATSSDLIPYVRNFDFELYNKSDTEITGNTADKFPYKVVLTLSVVDKTSYDRWVASGKTNNDLLNAGMRTFTRVVLIERGQYD